MLIHSKNKNEKVVFGLMSYTYDNDVPSMEEQKKIIADYREDDAFDILLFKEPTGDNFIGLLIIEHHQVDDVNTIVIHRIALLPSYRNEGYGYQMYKELRDLYPSANVMGVLATADHIATWTKQYNEEAN